MLQTAFACTNRGIPTCSGGLQAPVVGRGVFGIRLAPFPWIDGGRVHQRWMGGMMRGGDNRQTGTKYYSPMPFFCRWSLHTSFWAIFLQPTQSSSSLPPSLCRALPALLLCSSPSLDAGGVGKGNSAPPTTTSRAMTSNLSSLVQERFSSVLVWQAKDPTISRSVVLSRRAKMLVEQVSPPN